MPRVGVPVALLLLFTSHALAQTEVLRPIDARLRRCLERRGEDPYPSARVSMYIDEEGRPQTISVMPAALQECVEPLIRSRTFPRTRRGREALVHVIRR